MLLPVSLALGGHDVFSPLFLTSVCDLVHPTRRLGACGAGLSCWRGGVWSIVFSSFQLSATECFEALLARLVFWLACRGRLVIRLLGC